MAKKTEKQNEKQNEKQDKKQPVKLIAFDFDGTITTRDTFALFLRYWAGTPLWILKIIRLLPIFALYGLRIIDRNRVKAHVVRVFFKNADEAELKSKAEKFAKEIIPGLIRPKALERLQERSKNPEYSVYIVSASIDDYLIPWAKQHNISNILATNLQKINGRLTGEISGINCWGHGKMVKIAEKMADKPYILLESYGDSRGDREMLHNAEVSFYKPFRF